MGLKLACIADDFTGATDLANNLVRAGMRTVQMIGVPDGPLPDADAVVVALKSRTAPVAEAVAESLAAARWLLQAGQVQLYFKVCSTFDSTAAGNIGPVAQALMDCVNAPFVPVTPAFPENGRTVFKGHLFVGDLLLSDSPMRNHPLTPMTDANLVRVLQAQTRHRVGLIDHQVVSSGADAIGARVAALRAQGYGLAIVDAIDDDDLRRLAAASASLPLLVAGSGLAIGIPALHGLSPRAQAARLPPPRGTRAIVSGSCSVATNAQVAAFLASGAPGFAVDPLRIAAGEDVAGQALEWAAARLPAGGPLLVYATAAAEALKAVQSRLGAGRAGALVEESLARIACGLVARGVGQLLVAGGETSGACVQALGIRQISIGVQIDPGVPWCHAQALHLHLALKSGNFGGEEFFSYAFDRL